jgi:hypothetical protein
MMLQLRKVKDHIDAVGKNGSFARVWRLFASAICASALTLPLVLMTSNKRSNSFRRGVGLVIGAFTFESRGQTGK